MDGSMDGLMSQGTARFHCLLAHEKQAVCSIERVRCTAAVDGFLSLVSWYHPGIILVLSWYHPGFIRVHITH